MAAQKKPAEHAVTAYTIGTINYKAAFPNGEKACKYCDFCRSQNAGTRFRCMLTAQILYDQSRTIGRNCPMEFYKTDINGEYIADDDNNNLEDDNND